MLASSIQHHCASPLPLSTDPSSPIGYLLEGRTYSERGYQRMAINMYGQGLSVTASSDPVYLQLQQAKKDAGERDNMRIDFITRLPMDILTWIAPRLIHEDLPLEYDSFKMHHASLLVSKHGSTTHTSRQHSSLAQLAPFVKSLTLDLPGVSFDDLWSLTPQFDMLKRLSISHMIDFDDDPAPFEPDRIVEGLRIVGDSLTHLKLHHFSIDSDATIPLQSVLDACPHLTTLNMNPVDPDLSGATLTFPRLTTLNIYLKAPVSNQAVTKLLNKLPCLESFSINHCSDKMIVATFLDHCSSLRYVEFGVFPCGSDEQDDDQFDTNIQFPKRYKQLSAGKMKLVLNNIPSNPFTPQELVTILKRYSPVLETLVISAEIPNVPEQVDASLQLDHVKQLVVNLPDPPDRHHDLDALVGLPGFIMRHTPNVERVAVPRAQMNSSTMQLMTQLSHLKDLELARNYMLEADHTYGIMDFFEYHEALGTQSTLERLRIHSTDDDDPSAPFHGINSLRNLRELCIYADFPLTARYADDLEMIAESCPSLTSLSLQTDEGILDCLMYALRHFKNLKELHVTADKISEAGALSCLTCRHLEELEVSCINDLGHIFPLLKNVIPKVYSYKFTQ